MGGAGRARRISPAVRAWSGDLQNKHLTHWVARDSESGTRGGGGGERERETEVGLFGARRLVTYLTHLEINTTHLKTKLKKTPLV